MIRGRLNNSPGRYSTHYLMNSSKPLLWVERDNPLGGTNIANSIGRFYLRTPYFGLELLGCVK